nr:hypothetical protein [uncultured Celeribacter sp.]
MKPNFALNLSHDGILLLHRATAGWHPMGTVDLDAEDVAAELSKLRRTATEVSAAGLATKLVIPNSQILYRSLPFPEGDEAARDMAIRSALEGATPYSLDQLVWDSHLSGDQLQMAVVARETLDEAEAFATEHQFNPVSFVAQPEPDRFGREPFFGRAKSADALIGAETDVEPDREILRVLTPRGLSDSAASFDHATPVAKPETPEAPAKAPTAKSAEEAPRAETAEPSAAKTASKTPDPEPDTDDTAPDAAAKDPAARRIATKPGHVIPAPRAPQSPQAPAPAVAAPKAALTGDKPVAAPAPAPHADIAAREVPPAPEQDALKPKPPKPRKTGPLPEPPPMPSSSAPSSPMPAPNVAVVAQPAKAEASRSSGRLGALKTLTSRSGDKVTPSKAAPEPGPVQPPVTIPLADETLAPMSDRAAGLDNAENALDEAEAMTIFGARQNARTSRGKPRYLGLYLTGGLIVLLLLLWLVAGWLPRSETSQDTALSESTSQSPEIAQSDLTTGAVLSDADAERQLALTDSDPALEEPELTPELLDEATQPAPASLNTQTKPSLEEVQTQYAATGIWPLAPLSGDGALPEDTIDAIYVASIDPAIPSQDAVALPEATRQQVDPLPLTATRPLTSEDGFDLDENGFVRATKDGAVTPEGAVVYAGRPDVVPAPRPGSRVDDAVEAALTPEAAGGLNANAAQREALAGFRPTPRPEALIENNEMANLAGLTRAQLGAMRPMQRPISEQEQAADDARANGEAAPAATAPVVAVSQIPQARPQDFSKLVAAAQAASEAAAAAADAGTTTRSAATQVTARVPDSPTPSSAPTSVARAATVKNAIRLRDVNLMGVYGGRSDRRALVRLPSGRFAKVKVGDKLDGGQVQSIGASSLTYVKRGRAITLEVAG